MPARQAACHCGQLRLEVTGDPFVVSICHCLDCQRRTGSAFGMQSAFKPDQVQIVGRYSGYSRISEEADEKEHVFHFCPDCGSQVFYTEPTEPDLIVISVGAFADPEFPPPTESGYNSRRHRWLDLPESIDELRARALVAGPPALRVGQVRRGRRPGARAARRSSPVRRPGLQRGVLREPRGTDRRRDRAPPRSRSTAVSSSARWPPATRTSIRSATSPRSRNWSASPGPLPSREPRAAPRGALERCRDRGGDPRDRRPRPRMRSTTAGRRIRTTRRTDASVACTWGARA